MTSPSTEMIVLVDDGGRAIGTMPKPLVHHGETPLHRAFSAYLFDDDGRLLVTRRADGKQTFPGMWTNTVCGHPGPDEDDDAAIARRAGLRAGPAGERSPPRAARLPLPGGVPRRRGERDLPRLPGPLRRLARPDPTEVGAWEVLDWAAFRQRQETEGDAWSPWCREQARMIEEAGLVPAV